MCPADGPSDSVPMMSVAQYVRASTDHQRYSAEGQSEANARYAAQRGMQIVRTYADDGRSGLTLRDRPALLALLDDIANQRADFRAVLVYDVSRWGRFQDVDESAYYEYLCRRAGVNVIYCAESFGDDGSPMAALVKAIKRAMAGEFSRELSKKVFAGQCRLVERGYRQGGVPGYALRRLLIGENGEAKGVLNPGERKSRHTDRVVLVPGPDNEVAVVRRIYERYINDNASERQIVRELNADGLLTDQGKPWCRAAVKQILTNEKYAGANVYNRESFKLRARRAQNPREIWVRKECAYASIVSQEQFDVAQRVRAAYAECHSEAFMVAELRRLLARHGRLSSTLVENESTSVKWRALVRKFGSLRSAFQAAGYDVPNGHERLARIRHRTSENHALVRDFMQQLRRRGIEARRESARAHLTLPSGLTIRLLIVRHVATHSALQVWRKKCAGQTPHFFAVIRLVDKEPRAYFLFPAVELPTRPSTLVQPTTAKFRVASIAAIVLAVKALETSKSM